MSRMSSVDDVQWSKGTATVPQSRLAAFGLAHYEPVPPHVGCRPESDIDIDLFLTRNRYRSCHHAVLQWFTFHSKGVAGAKVLRRMSAAQTKGISPSFATLAGSLVRPLTRTRTVHPLSSRNALQQLRQALAPSPMHLSPSTCAKGRTASQPASRPRLLGQGAQGPGTSLSSCTCSEDSRRCSVVDQLPANHPDRAKLPK
jgi:hypothetical protein